MLFLERVYKLLMGSRLPLRDVPGQPKVAPPGYEREVDDPMPLYGTFSLRDGHKIASDLKRNEIPFAVEFNDGIEKVSEAFGSGGHEATLSLYVEERHWGVVRDIIEVRFRYRRAEE